jgi:hypothetical protein
VAPNPWRRPLLATLRATDTAVILIVIKFGQRQGASSRRFGRHWRVRWSCWRGRRRCWRASWTLSRRGVWDCHARKKSRRQALVRPERRQDGSKNQGCYSHNAFHRSSLIFNDLEPPFELSLPARRHWDRLARDLHGQCHTSGM